MSQWYLTFDSGKQLGPLTLAEAVAKCRENSRGLCWKKGFSEWLPISQVPELATAAGSGSPPPSKPRPPALSPPSPGPTPSSAARADEIDFQIYGEDMQYVEVELDPGESVVAEAGAMMFKDPTIQLQTIFGDGRPQTRGFLEKLLGAGQRLLTGESLFMTVFTHEGRSGKVRVAFAAPYPGTIIPLRLSSYGGTIICQKDSFLCAAKGVEISIAFQRKILTGLFGGEGFIMQKLTGDGMTFVHAGGTIREFQLKAGETLHVDTGCVVAYTATVQFDLQKVGGIKSMLFGGEGVFFAHLKGPGHVWLQSLPFSRLAGRMLSATRSHKGEGSMLGGLGGLLDGDNF